jgi:glycosyltransferase involved in cell wall biosynthesis
MKIAIVCFNLSWQSGGPRLIFSMAQSLKASGHQVVIYAPEFSGEYFKELWQGLDIRVVPPPEGLSWSGRPKSLWTKILKKVKEEKLQKETAKRIAAAIAPDIDVLNMHDYAYPVAYFYKKRNPKVKAIWTSHDLIYMYLPKDSFFFDVLSRFYNYTKDLLSRKYFKAIDRVSVLESFNQDWCRRRGLDATIVRLGVDYDNFYLPVKEFKERAKRKEVRLFGLGSLNKYRHYEDLISAVKFLREWGYDASALIIASDFWNEKAYREKILELVEKNELKEFIEFNFGGASEEGLREAYRKSDIFVYAMYVPPPRNGYTLSIGVFEAMAAGLPVILCNTTASVEVLEDGKTALFVDPLSPEQIAEKAKFLVDNPERYFEIASAGQKFVKENLTWDKYARGVLKLIES